MKHCVKHGGDTSPCCGNVPIMSSTISLRLIFRNDLQPQLKLLLDATASGSLMSKSAKDAIIIIDRMTLNDHQVQYNRGPSQKKSRNT